MSVAWTSAPALPTAPEAEPGVDRALQLRAKPALPLRAGRALQFRARPGADPPRRREWADLEPRPLPRTTPF